MLLWLTQFFLLSFALFALLYALSKVVRPLQMNDVEFYKAQLKDIETARFEHEPERAQAKLEVSRKLLKAAPSLTLTSSLHAKRGAAIALLCLVPLGTYGVYGFIGNPELPAQPLAQRKVPANAPIVSMVNRVETHLSKNPDDVKGWEVLAPIYMQMENYEGAVEARRNLLRLLGTSAERLNDLAEASLLKNNGVISAQIEELFKEASRLDPTNMRANYYQGLALLQDGKNALAIEKWKNLMDKTTNEAERTFLQQEILRVKP